MSNVEDWPSPHWTVSVHGPTPATVERAEVDRRALAGQCAVCGVVGAVSDRRDGIGRDHHLGRARAAVRVRHGKRHGVGPGVARAERERGAGPVGDVLAARATTCQS